MRKLLVAAAAVVAAGLLAPAGAVAHGVTTKKPNWYLAPGRFALARRAARRKRYHGPNQPGVCE
jgi:hypothetical protein